MRKAGAAILFMLAGAGILVAVSTISNLWVSYQDSPDSTYIEGASIAAGLALLFVVSGFLILRHR